MLWQPPLTLKGKLAILHFPLNPRTRSPSSFFTRHKSITISHKLRSHSSSNDLIIANDNSAELELLEKPTAAVAKEQQEVAVEESSDDEENESMTSFMSVFSADPYLEEETMDEWVPSTEEDVEFYDPKVGDLVLGVVVSGNAHRIDVNIGADALATMLEKEVLPLHDQEMERVLCEVAQKDSVDAGDFFSPGKVGVVKNEEALSPGPAPGRPVVDFGTVLCAEVLGRTLGGKPLLSSRRVTRRIAWQRVRQIKKLNEPIDVCISEWNTGGLVTRIEGLRAFLPKIELVNKPYENFTTLRSNVGRQITVLITRVDEENGDLIISEREAWVMKHLCEGTLLEGSITKIFSYGAQVRVDGTSLSGLLHITNISRARVQSVKKLFSEGEKVKVMVTHSVSPNKISFSTADLESEKGLMLSDKQKVFDEAEKMATAYRQKLSSVLGFRRSKLPPEDVDQHDNGAEFYANWSWVEFEAEIPQ
ncbi:hypothetical protein SUGI_0148170 [Cryptomeria japonica]|uniref:protein PIGMENT DEFECTIVE 338, chloroplastic n=1 Tax=Cryptomeria japonica TaxID=3369 RepID=UPI002408CC81|nr:protein PIGMENT DEFECTIVE 338, chloroplastic [Cryptomeria japonica]GLJ11238.1 hypothetical protein SUGI_0148170 [Cryptomeria japonica]